MKLPLAVAKFFDMPGPDGKITTLEYFTELIVKNGGASEVTEFKPGFELPQAFHLVQLVNFLKGILYAIGHPEIEFDILQFVRNEVKRKQSGSVIYEPTIQEVNKFGR